MIESAWLQSLLSLLTVVFVGAALVGFIRQLLAKTAKPYLWAWVIRMALVLVAFMSQLMSGATYSLAMSGSQLAICLLIIGLIVRTQPRMGALGRWDVLAIGAAAVGVAWWILSGNPLYGLIGTMAADTAATALGIHAAYTRSARESSSFWACCLGAGVTAALVAGTDNLVVLLAPLFSCLNAVANIAAIHYIKKRRRRTAPRRQYRPRPVLDPLSALR